MRMRSALARMRFAFSSGRKSLTLKTGPASNDAIKQTIKTLVHTRVHEMHLTAESAVFGRSVRDERRPGQAVRKCSAHDII